MSRAEQSPLQDSEVYRLRQSGLNLKSSTPGRRQARHTNQAVLLGAAVHNSLQLLNRNPVLRHSEGSGEGGISMMISDRHWLVRNEISSHVCAAVPKEYDSLQKTEKWLPKARFMELYLQTFDPSQPDQDPLDEEEVNIEIYPTDPDTKAEDLVTAPYTAAFFVEGPALDIPDTKTVIKLLGHIAEREVAAQ